MIITHLHSATFWLVLYIWARKEIGRNMAFYWPGSLHHANDCEAPKILSLQHGDEASQQDYGRPRQCQVA